MLFNNFDGTNLIRETCLVGHALLKGETWLLRFKLQEFLIENSMKRKAMVNFDCLVGNYPH